MAYGFIKTACVSPRLKVADCIFNAEQIVNEAKIAAKKGASIIVFPELSITLRFRCTAVIGIEKNSRRFFVRKKTFPLVFFALSV